MKDKLTSAEIALKIASVTAIIVGAVALGIALRTSDNNRKLSETPLTSEATSVRADAQEGKESTPPPEKDASAWHTWDTKDKLTDDPHTMSCADDLNGHPGAKLCFSTQAHDKVMLDLGDSGTVTLRNGMDQTITHVAFFRDGNKRAPKLDIYADVVDSSGNSLIFFNEYVSDSFAEAVGLMDETRIQAVVDGNYETYRFPKADTDAYVRVIRKFPWAKKPNGAGV